MVYWNRGICKYLNRTVFFDCKQNDDLKKYQSLSLVRLINCQACRELPGITEQDPFPGVHFSKFGTVRNTLLEAINKSVAGFRSKELYNIIGVEIKKPIPGLLADKQIVREKISGSYIYFSVDTDTGKKQELARNNSLSNYAMNPGGFYV